MPRYYFDLRDDLGLFQDEEGAGTPEHQCREVRNEVGPVKSGFEIDVLV
jgi:hypothetical protein